MHDSEPVRIANPSPYETFIHNTLPVLPAHRNPKQTQRQIDLKLENPKHRIRRKLVWNFTYFGHLKLFRISDFVLRISCSWRLLRESQFFRFASGTGR